ncbi:MAG: YciI family protein [Oligoflexales bacterium]
MALYVYKLALQPRYYDFSTWDEKVQETFKRHAEYLHKGVTTGKVHVVGRSDQEPKKNYGIVIFEDASEQEAKQFMNDDPCIVGGVMTAELAPFKLLMVSNAAKKWNIW